MSTTIRSLTMIAAVVATTLAAQLAALPVAGAAGERDITVAQGIDAEFLDVQMTNNIVTLIINTSVYDTLLTRDKQLQLVGNLAVGYKLVSEKVWEVKLRQGVKFHNGEPFDAGAVKFSFERINRPDFKSRQKGWFSPIDHVEIVDPFTVRFHTKVPDPAMPARMALMYQLAPKYVAQVGDVQANLKPVGTGPFKFVEWQKNERIVVEANEAHWSGKPAVRRATWRPIPELGARNGRWAMDKDIAQAVAGQLTENGIKTNVKIIGEWGSHVRSVLDHKTEDIFMNGWCLPSLEPDHWVTPNLHTGEPVSQYSNPEIDKLMEQARSEMNAEKRKQLYSQLLRLIRDDAPWIFGYQQMDIYGVSNRLKWTPRGDESIRLTEISF